MDLKGELAAALKQAKTHLLKEEQRRQAEQRRLYESLASQVVATIPEQLKHVTTMKFVRLRAWLEDPQYQEWRRGIDIGTDDIQKAQHPLVRAILQKCQELEIPMGVEIFHYNSPPETHHFLVIDLTK